MIFLELVMNFRRLVVFWVRCRGRTRSIRGAHAAHGRARAQANALGPRTRAFTRTWQESTWRRAAYATGRAHAAWALLPGIV